MDHEIKLTVKILRFLQISNFCCIFVFQVRTGAFPGGGGRGRQPGEHTDAPVEVLGSHGDGKRVPSSRGGARYGRV